ncbi:MAG: peptidoglycan-binding protein [Patescibacteria group bacterium]
MTIANNTVIAKIFAVLAVAGLVVSSVAAFAPVAGAQTTTTTTTTSTSMMFSRDLTLGSTGADVTALQNLLISNGYAIPAGATGYFGAQTQAAVAKWQAAEGISPAAGYFGPITRAKVNAMGTGTGTGTGSDNDDDEDEDEDEDEDDSNDDLSGGEASLEDYNANSGDEDDVEEGGEADVAEFEFDVEDGDVRIDRLDLAFETDTAVSGADDEPWEVFATVTIMDEDGEELASEDVSEEDDWLENDEEPYEFRFTDLDYVVREGDQGTLMVRVEVQDGVDGVESGDIDWEIGVLDEGIRGTDGEGIEQYIGGNDGDLDDADDSVNFDITEEGEDDDLSVRRSSDDPDATTLEVEEDETSDWYKIFVFELDSDEDSDDIEVNDIGVSLETLGVAGGITDVTTETTVINDLMLKIDGEEFDDFDTSATSTRTLYTFDTEDEDLMVAGGESTAVEVWAEFSGSDNYEEGQTVDARVDGFAVDAEGEDDIDVDGSATGDTHTLRSMGVDVDPTDSSATTEEVDGADNDTAEFELVVDIEAFEQDVFVPKNAALAFTYAIEDGNGNVISSSTATSSAIASDADEDGAYYVVDEGSTEEFRLSVNFNPLAGDEGKFFRLQVLTIRYNDSAATPDTTYTAEPMNDFETDQTVVND